MPVDTDADPDTWELPAGPDGAPAAPVIVWLNSPGNPDGHVLGVEQLARIVAWVRHRGAVVVADECYAELAAFGLIQSVFYVCQRSFIGPILVHVLVNGLGLATVLAGSAA